MAVREPLISDQVHIGLPNMVFVSIIDIEIVKAVRVPLISTYGVFLVLLLEDTLFSLLGWGGALEVGVIDTVWNGNTRNVQLGRGGDDGRLSAATEWDTVNLVWASDQKETRLELLQKNNALTTVNTGKKDQDGTWGN